MNEMQREITRLKKERNAIILAHYYQRDEIQEVADYVGDSFGLSQTAAATDAEVIVFCGVHFMAESAYILAPSKTILLPEPLAGCPMADMAHHDAVFEARKQYPEAALVAYVNTTAAVKAHVDICCTSANAVKVVESLPQEEIIFLPDRNLANWIQKHTKKHIIPWAGYCNTHDRLTKEQVLAMKEQHPEATVLVHPECKPEVVALADGVFSTTGIAKHVKNSSAKEFIIGTESGILRTLKKENPDKQFYLSDSLICPNMKANTLPKVLHALQTMAL
jgi:quinolinate synthase